MRRKTLFSMCAFAAVLAGCSNEELINVQPEASLTDRATVNFVLSSNAGGYKLGDTDAETRTIWKDGNYYWDSTTKLGACIVDGAAQDVPAYDGIVTNHPFVPVEAITTPVQSADFKTDTEVREGVYLFYHQYDSKAIQDRKLYCEFPTTQIMEDASKPYDHLTKQNFFISPLIKITDGIEDGATNEVPVKFVSMFSGFAPTFVNESGKDIEISKVEVVSSTPDAFKVGGYINTITAAAQFDGVVVTGDYKTTEALAEAIQEKADGLQDGTRDLYNATGIEQASSVSINLPNIKVAAGASQEIRMLFPAGVYVNGSLTVKVYATDGTVCSVVLKSSDNQAITFDRNVFGTKEMKLENFEKITAIDIYSIEDWRYALTVKRENEVIPFKLMNDIEIESTEDIPSFALKVISNASEKLILKGENTYEFNDQSEIANLEINEGATLNYKGGKITTLINQKGATLNIQKDVTVGASNTIATLTNNGTMTIAKDVTLDNKASGFTNTGAKAILNNNGTLLLSDAWTNNATLNNSGVIAIANDKTLTNSENCTIYMNDGYFWYKAAATDKIENSGTIVLANAKDVFMFGATQPAADDTRMTKLGQGTVSLVAKSTDNVDLTKIAEVTAITLTGDGWNKDNIAKAKANMAALTFKDATADLKGCGDTDYAGVDFTLEGTTVLNNSATATDGVTVKSLTAAKDAKVTLNGAKQALSVLNNVTIAAGATMTNNTAIAMIGDKEVRVNGTLNNAGAINVPGATDAEKSITVEVANTGILNNTGELACGNYNTFEINVSGKANFTGGKAYGVLTLNGSAATTGDVIAKTAPTAVVETDAPITELITAGCKEIYVGVTTTETTITGADVTVYLLKNANVTLASGNNTVGSIVIADASAVLAGTATSNLTANSFIVAVDSWTIGNNFGDLKFNSIDAKCNFTSGAGVTNIKNVAGTANWTFDTLTNRWKLGQ